VTVHSPQEAADSTALRWLTASRLTWLVSVPLLLLLLAYGLRAAFHSDELNVLLHVERFARGEFRAPGRPGLLWLALTPLMILDEPTALLKASRVVAVLSVALGLSCIAHLGKPRHEQHSWVERLLPAVAVLLVMTSASFATHAVEVRTDTFTTPLTLLALVILWRRQWTPRTVILAAVVVSAAILCSQKSAYNAIGLALAWSLARPAQPADSHPFFNRARDAGVAVAVVVGLVGLWYAALSMLAGTGGDLVSTNFERAASTAFAGTVPFEDKRAWLGQAVHRAPVLYVGGGLGLVIAAVRARTDGRVFASALVALTMYGVMPIHRGFFPYYIASIEPLLALPAALAVLTVANGIAGLLLRARIPRNATVALVTIAVLGGALDHQRPALEQAWNVTNEGQLELAGRVHAMFGKPVPHVAGLNLIPGYPESAGYLTGEARTAKRKKDPIFLATKLKSGAHFFVRAYMTRDLYLKATEKQLIYRSYLPVSSNLYVHGARARWEPGTTPGHRVAGLFVDGTYTVRFRGVLGAEAPEFRVDEQLLGEGEVVELTKGNHRLSVGPSATAGEVWLLLGDGITPEPPGAHVDYSLFPKDRNGSRSRYQRYDKKRGKYDLASPTNPNKNRIRRHKKRLHDLDARYESKVLVRREPEPSPPQEPVPLQDLK